MLACRERGRHLFPSIRQGGIYFNGVDDDGLFIRRLTCDCCRLAFKVEKWEGVRQRGRTRFRRVGSTLGYRTGNDGQSYLAPSGRGHMTARQIGDSVASKALSGQSLAALRMAAERTGHTWGPAVRVGPGGRSAEVGVRQVRYCDLTGSEEEVASHGLQVDQMRVEIDPAGPEYRKLLELLQP